MRHSTVQQIFSLTWCFCEWRTDSGRKYCRYGWNKVCTRRRETDTDVSRNAYRAVANALGSAINSPSFVPNFTRGQLFFVAFAQTWCEKATDEYLKNQVKTDVHSPAMFRVNGPFTNLVNFAETFNCPVGSPMNPTQRCEVW
eukprot:TRINITY_DN1643_c0_g2_i3.p1 TRINITY_DN1643_c0_g2~~TRINITY_DN1643_c0_g2_i3.p1  ORF type:complete len:142 (+),score=15.07 TRINITY_DN1643_c0_g2_i3:391-816(+)